MRTSLSGAEARRLALGAQGFGSRPSRRPGRADVLRLARRLHAFQIDSVNVLVRAHYFPAFARLGPYEPADLDALAYQERSLFEYWGHAACLLPVSLHPLLRYRMRTDEAREHMRSAGGAYTARVYEEVAERGPLAVADLADPGRRSSKWWGWGPGKSALEHLFLSGLVAVSGRRGFERLYDLVERVLPASALAAPVPPGEEAMKQLICLGAQACGVGSFIDVTGYLYVDGWLDRRPPGPWWERREGARRRRLVGRRLVAELVEEGRLVAAEVEGWTEPAYLHPDARVPRSLRARALVTPFDSLVWERSRMRRLFGMDYTIEIYTPAAKRVYGYYVCPFLLGDTLVGRVDLKADRASSTLVVQGAFLEPDQEALAVAPELLGELRLLQGWLRLTSLEIARRGDLADALLRTAAPG